MAEIVTVGTLESSDCMVTLEKGKGAITIDTVVHEAFYDHIKTLVETFMHTNEMRDIDVRINDKGALDYAITARLQTALSRYRGEADG